MVHATLTGVSAVYGPSGARVGSWLGTDRSASEVYDVPLARGVTPYVRFGDWPVHGALRSSPGCARPRACVRSESDGALLHRSHHPLAQFVSRQCVTGTEHLARTDGVEEGQRGLLDTALPGHRHPVPAPAHGRLTLWSTTSARLSTCRLESWPDTSSTSSAEPLSRFITPSA